jgi:hypothetical protein
LDDELIFPTPPSTSSHIYNLVRHEANSHFRNKKREYLKSKFNELKTSKNKNVGDLYRNISVFNKGYQPRTNIGQDEKSDLVADCHSILARWKNHFSQLLNVHRVNDVRQTEIRTADPLVPEPRALEVGMVIEKLKIHANHNVLIKF